MGSVRYQPEWGSLPNTSFLYFPNHVHWASMYLATFSRPCFRCVYMFTSRCVGAELQTRGMAGKLSLGDRDCSIEHHSIIPALVYILLSFQQPLCKTHSCRQCFPPSSHTGRRDGSPVVHCSQTMWKRNPSFCWEGKNSTGHITMLLNSRTGEGRNCSSSQKTQSLLRSLAYPILCIVWNSAVLPSSNRAN